ncbi:MAG: endolytic transglycosylase MltG, partial [Arsenophonus sp. NC-QC1-MAG3]
MKYARRILWLIIFLLILSACIIYIFYCQIQNYADTTINIHETTIFTLPAGTGRAELESLLTEQEIIKSPNKFQWLLRLEPSLAQFKIGTYRLNPGITLRAMLKMFFTGKEAQFSLLFIEGSRFEDWKKVLYKAPYLRQTTDKLAQQIGLPCGQSLEGWFYPDTYYYTAKVRDIDILKRAHQRMITTLKYEWEERASNLPYKTPYEMLIMASIIEKETAIDIERPKVA